MAGLVAWFATGRAAQNALAESGGNLPTVFSTQLWKREIIRKRHRGIQRGFCPIQHRQGIGKLGLAAEGETASRIAHALAAHLGTSKLEHAYNCCLQERTGLQSVERLAALYLLWQAGRDLPLAAYPFGPALLEVGLATTLA